MFRCARHKWLAAVSSITLASIRVGTTSISSAGISTSSSSIPERGPNLLKEPVTPTKITISNSNQQNTCSIIKTGDDVYDNKDSTTTYQIEPPIAKQQATITRLPWDTV